MNKLFFLLFILPISGFSQDKQIICQNTTCSTNFLPQSSIDKTLFTSILMGNNNLQNVSVSVPDGDKPRSVRLYVEQNSTTFDKNLTIDLSSQNSAHNAADTLVIADIFNNVNIKTNGFQGANGKDASMQCAESFKAGATGFGESAKSEFEFRRITDLTLPTNRCSFVDIQYLQDNNFTCGEEGYSEIDANNPSVLVRRLKGKYRCVGLSYHNVCLSKTVRVECKWKIKYTDPPAVSGTFSSSPNDEEVKYFTMSEYDYNLNINKPGFKEYACENLTRLIDESDPTEAIRNGEFYNNLSSWTNEGAIWISSEKIKLTGGDTVANKSVATQSIITEPGRKYRLRATWSKATDESIVNSGQISIYSDFARVNEIVNEKIYSPGSIKGVFLTSDDAPHHYGYMRINTASLPKSFNIINRDDRVARNCSPVYLAGPDASHFIISADNCSNIDLDVGQSCSVEIRSRPTSIGEKEARLRRDCSDEFGNSTSSLNEPIYATAYQDYTQTTVMGQPAGQYTDTFYWRLISGTWHRCSLDFAQGKNCFNTSPVVSTLQCVEKGVFCPGYNPVGMTIPAQPASANVDPFPFVQHSSISANLRVESRNVDIIFTATTPNTLIELSTVLKYHPGVFDSISLIPLSPNSGPSIKPPSTLSCPNAGCVAGALGNGYYALFGTPTRTETTPGFNSTYYTIPNDSDWRIRYVPISQSCPVGFNLIKSNHLASNIAYDDDDDQCNDISIPEDPTNKVISWKYVGFDRLPEFGVELVQCLLGDCVVQSSIREADRNIITYNPGSGSDGTQQGGGLFFVYDVKNFIASSLNGRGGTVGANDIPNINSQKVCAKIRDASTEGENSLYAKNPVVDFQKLRWKAIKVLERGNFGSNPTENGKTIKIYKKMDSSIRYLLQKEFL